MAPPAPSAAATATLVIALEGLPVSERRRDSWVDNAHNVKAKLSLALTQALDRRGWTRIRTVIAQEAFGDSIEDPADELVSVAEAFAAARNRGDSLVTAMPVAFLSENTDTLFLHSC